MRFFILFLCLLPSLYTSFVRADETIPSRNLKEAVEEMQRSATETRYVLHLLQVTMSPTRLTPNYQEAVKFYVDLTCKGLKELRFEGKRAREFTAAESARLDPKLLAKLVKLFATQDHKLPAYEERCAALPPVSQLGFGEQAELENALRSVQTQAEAVLKKL